MRSVSILSEGGLLPYDLLEKVAQGEVKGQKPEEFGLKRNERFSDTVASVWGDARAYWEAFQRALRHLPESDSAATVTREQWILPLLRSLGYSQLTYMSKAAIVEGQTFALSHRAGSDEDGPPVHIEGWRVELDRRPPSGRPRLSPHALLQEYLNRTEHLWGIVTNGGRFRLLRDSQRTSRPSFLEFNLQQIMEGEQYAEFALSYRLIHRTRLPRGSDDAHKCWLETYHQEAVQQGGRVRDRLRDGVEQALKLLGEGLISHPRNTELRKKHLEKTLSPQEYYRQLLRLVYRVLFLMVAEERRLLGGTDPYHRHYSLTRLRILAEKIPMGAERHHDLWIGLLHTFRLFENDEKGKLLGLSPLNGDLFGYRAIPDLEGTDLSNKDLLQAIRYLSLWEDRKVLRRVNYAALDVEELGSVYESLLDFGPVIETHGESLHFELLPGTERKSTGSYYTHPDLVHELIKSALDPVIEDRVKEAKTQGAREKTLLSLKVCDPACGSGHFLLAAARRIGRELARIRNAEDPTPDQYRLAVRDAITHCLYGVDLNPLAVDLCKLALWIEGHHAGKPLTFLDHRIKCGNSLIGVLDPKVFEEGIPDAAFDPVTGDDKNVSKVFKQQNRNERGEWTKGRKQLLLPFPKEAPAQHIAEYAEVTRRLTSLPDDTPEGVKSKADLYENTRHKEDWWRDSTLAHLWTAAFFVPLTEKNRPHVCTHTRFLDYQERDVIDGRASGKAHELASEHHFFHWHLEFPEVFQDGGFDVVLGNPPWETVQLEEKQFFSVRDSGIAKAPNKAAREKLIKTLPESSQALAREFEKAKHAIEATCKFLRQSNRYPLTAQGKINTYAVFAELARSLIAPTGRAGIIVPTGIATDDTCKGFFQDVLGSRALVSLYDFENRKPYFSAVDSRFKFSLVSFAGVESPVATGSEFSLFAHQVEDLGENMRRFVLSAEEIALINPNTRTCPVFRTRTDAELTRKIYQRVPILVNEVTGENPWGARFRQGLFNMSNDSHLFRTLPQLESCGWKLDGNRFTKDKEVYLPLYEAKMLHQFDHRYGSYETRGEDRGFSTLPETPLEKYQSPQYLPIPYYWVPAQEVETQLKGKWDHGWLLGFRDIARNTDIRTAIFAILPRVGVGHNAPLVFLESSPSTQHFACFLANADSLVFDYITRQKLGGTHLTYFILKQLPVIPPGTYTESDLAFIVPRVLELVYTAWDLEPFARDLGYGGPPFRWDEDRRALLRAELDAYYAKLYGLTEEELRYILDPQDVMGPDFPGETFRVLKENETRKYGEYRTKRLVLEAWHKLCDTATSVLKAYGRM